jgi:hypothetical protein
MVESDRKINDDEYWDGLNNSSDSTWVDRPFDEFAGLEVLRLSVIIWHQITSHRQLLALWGIFKLICPLPKKSKAKQHCLHKQRSAAGRSMEKWC